MNWYKIKDDRINLSRVVGYLPSVTMMGITFMTGDRDITVFLDSNEEALEEIKKLDEALEKGLHTLKEFNLP